MHLKKFQVRSAALRDYAYNNARRSRKSLPVNDTIIFYLNQIIIFILSGTNRRVVGDFTFFGVYCDSL